MAKKSSLKRKKKKAISKLTKRERDILCNTCLGYTSKDIANYLKISHYTVEMHRKNMMNKLDARNTANLIYKASTLGIIKELEF